MNRFKETLIRELDRRFVENKPEKTILVVFHANCWDGFCAAWAARRYFNQQRIGHKVEYYAAHHGAPPPSDYAGKDVYLVDFTYPLAIMRNIYAEAKSLNIFDHHATAEATVKEFIGQPNVAVSFDLNKSGGRLTWEAFFAPERSNWLVDYTEDRDLWRHQLNESKAVNAFIRAQPFDFETWDRMSAYKDPQFAIAAGTAILVREKQVVDTAVANAWEMEIGGHRVWVTNVSCLFSEVAEALIRDRPFGACYFDRKDGFRQWSLRSKAPFDVSQIAKLHGGGGHPQAAGFQIQTGLLRGLPVQEVLA